MSDNQSSSLKSYIDSATGTVQNTLGSLTGNSADQVSGTVFHVLWPSIFLAIAQALLVTHAFAERCSNFSFSFAHHGSISTKCETIQLTAFAGQG